MEHATADCQSATHRIPLRFRLPPFSVLAENAGGSNPYFATGAGGLLQAMLNGFGGLEITSKGIIQVKSKLPVQWKPLTLTGIGAEKKTFVIK